jgi:hypothetical protein
VEAAKHVDVFEVGFGDAVDGDIVDIQFIAFEEVEEKVERAVINIQLDAIFRVCNVFHEPSLVEVVEILSGLGGGFQCSKENGFPMCAPRHPEVLRRIYTLPGASKILRSTSG